ncbi:MAG: TonB-dependent receptor [Bacteroidia bacterium]|nr:TonB-dependent receptor [Bacteroidia bacterium]
MRRLLPFILLLSATVGMAQSPCTFRLSGIIRDASAGETLPLAKLELTESGEVTLSDIDGRFTFDSLCSGTYLLKVSYVGYDSLLQKVSIRGNTDLRLKLKPAAKQLKQAEVVAGRMAEKNTIASDTLSREDMERSRGFGLTEYLKKVSGVSGIQTGPSIMKPVIHGMHSQRIVIMNAGIRQEGQQWGTEHAPEIDPFVADRLTVIKGASSIRYGADAVGGVILVEPRRLPHEPGLQAEINLVGMSNGRQGVASGLIEQHLGKFFDLCWRLQGTVKKSGNSKTPDLYLQNTAFEEYNWSGSVGLERKRWGVELFYSSFNTKLGIFTGSHIGNLSDLQRIIESGQTISDNEFTYRIARPRQEVNHHLLSFKAFRTISNVGKLNLQYGYQFNHRFEYDRDRPLNDSLAGLDRPELELRLYTHTADLNLESRNVRGFTAVAGVSGMMQDNQYGGQRYFVPNYVLYNAAAYTMIRWRRKRWELEAGGRVDVRRQSVYRNVSKVVLRNDYDFVNPGLAAGAIFRQDSSITWRLNTGSAGRAPSINEWFSDGLHHGTATYETGDSTLGVEKAWNIIGSFSFRNQHLALEASLYYLSVADYIYLVPAEEPVLTVSGAFPAFQYRHVDAAFKGVDFSLDWDLSSALSFRSRNSLVFGRNLSAGRHLELVPSPRFDQLLSYRFKDGEHWKNLSAGVSLLYVARQAMYESGSDYIPPPPAYALVGVEASASHVHAGQEIRIGLSVNNLFNAAYREYMNRLRYYADEAGRNITLKLTIPLHFKTAGHAHPHE